VSRYDLGPTELALLLDGEPAYRVDQLLDGLYRQLAEPGELTVLPRALRERLGASPALAPAFHVVGERSSDRGATLKWLLEAADGVRVETVLMGYRDRTTACVSSQAGCAMACSFCATGQLGFGRHLTSGEILEQVVLAGRKARERGIGRLTNVVLMGMGEPLANYGNVLAALRRAHEWIGIAARSITVSTVGIVPGILRLAGEGLQFNLAVSLHAANDELRDELVPVNRRYDLAALMAACRRYTEATHRRITFEWALISGVNDGDRDAVELAGLARPLGAHVNVIPLNPTPGYALAGSPPATVAAFRDRLRALGVNVTVRATRGRSVDAACGQLAAGLAPGGLRRPRAARVAAPARLA
jgi:23S rRNA (adenine2503-C2)-methyltransferase